MATKGINKNENRSTFYWFSHSCTGGPLLYFLYGTGTDELLQL